MSSVNVTGSLGGGLTMPQKQRINSEMKNKGFKNFNIDDHTNYGSNNKTTLNLGGYDANQSQRVTGALNEIVENVAGKGFCNMKYKYAAPTANEVQPTEPTVNVAQELPNQPVQPAQPVVSRPVDPISPTVQVDPSPSKPHNETNLPTVRGTGATSTAAPVQDPFGQYPQKHGRELLNDIVHRLDSAPSPTASNDLNPAAPTVRTINDLVNEANIDSTENGNQE